MEKTPEKYRLIKTIGQGGMAAVDLVEEIPSGRVFARKTYLKGDAGSLSRYAMKMEPEVLLDIRHWAIPYLHEAEDLPDKVVLVMEYVPGKSLRRLINDGRFLDTDLVREWMGQLCDLLTYLHGRMPPVFHGDIKPDNLIIREDGKLSLIDFGTTRIRTDEKDLPAGGSPGYAAPERYASGGNRLDERSDIYAVGITMYEVLSLHRMSREKPEKLWREIHSREGVPMVPEALREISRHCTEKDAGKRIQTAEDLRIALIHFKELDPGRQAKDVRRIRAFAVMSFLSCGITAVSLADIATGFFRFGRLSPSGAAGIAAILLSLSITGALYLILRVRRAVSDRMLYERVFNHRVVSVPGVFTEAFRGREEKT